jgi:hypothetical protein
MAVAKPSPLAPVAAFRAGHPLLAFIANLVVLTLRRPLLVYPGKQTSSKPVGTSQKCQ